MDTIEKDNIPICANVSDLEGMIDSKNQTGNNEYQGKISSAQNPNIKEYESTPIERTYTTILLNQKTNYTFSFLTLISLYLQIGILLGYNTSLSIALQAKGATYHNQALLSLLFLPMATKVLIAPFVDSQFIQKIGKCKTYILVSGLLNSVLLLMLSYNIESYINKVNIWAIFTHMLPIMVSVAFQDVAVDCWMLTILNFDQRPKGGIAIWFGLGFGWWIGYPMFTQQNSHSLVSFENFHQFMSLYVFQTTIFITIFVAEANMTRGLKSMKDVVFLVSTVFKNPKIRLWMKWALLKQVGMVVCFKPFDQKMIDIVSFFLYKKRGLKENGSQIFYYTWPRLFQHSHRFQKLFLLKEKSTIIYGCSIAY